MNENEKQTYYENLDGYRAAIEEMQMLLEKQLETVESIKDTAKQILSSGSLIVAIVGVLPLFNVSISNKWYNMVLLGVTMLVYLVLIGICTYILRIKQYSFPIKADWDVLYSALINRDNVEDVYNCRLNSYISTFQENKPGVERLTHYVNIASILLPITVVLLLTMGLLSFL